VGQSSLAVLASGPITVLASGPIVRSGDAISIELHQPESMPAAVASSGRPHQRSPHPPATTKWPAQPCSYSLKRPPCSPDSKQANGVTGSLAWSRR
jgi:hypothetical protein